MDNRHWSDLPPPTQASDRPDPGQPTSWAFHPRSARTPGSTPEPVDADNGWRTVPPAPSTSPPQPWRDEPVPDQGRWPEPYATASYDPVAQQPDRPAYGWATPAPASRAAAPQPVGPDTAAPAGVVMPEPAILDEPDEEPPGWLPVLACTVGAFLVPTLVYLLWAWSLSSEPPPNCVDAIGAACRSPRGEALANLRSVLPGLTAAVALALVTASGLRRFSRWRSPTIAFASAVIGAGVITLVTSALG